MAENITSAIEFLVSNGHVANDVEVLSIHNNLVLVSSSQKVVSRIARLATMQAREDPGDIRYSHEASWVTGEVASVTRPLTRYPRVVEDFIISDYPERQQIDWNHQDTLPVAAAVRGVNESMKHVADRMRLRTLDIPSYATARVNHALINGSFQIKRIAELATDIIDEHMTEYPFHELSATNSGLVHGDLHATNLVKNGLENIEIIDMDSLAIGPKTYDIASWRVRRELGDEAPVEQIVDHFRAENDWDEEIFRALMGWKIISSMTHILRYEKDSRIAENRISALGRCGVELSALQVGRLGDIT